MPELADQVVVHGDLADRMCLGRHPPGADLVGDPYRTAADDDLLPFGHASDP